MICRYSSGGGLFGLATAPEEEADAHCGEGGVDAYAHFCTIGEVAGLGDDDVC